MKTRNRIISFSLTILMVTSVLFGRIDLTAFAAQNDDFDIVTTYETSNYCKPNLDYYREVCTKMGVLPEECVMVGNDVSEDMVAEQLGMKVFLLTDCLINKENKDISAYAKGDFDDLRAYIEKLK